MAACFATINHTDGKLCFPQEIDFMQERVSGNVTASSLSSEELKAELDRLLLQKCTNEQIVDWIQMNLDEGQTASSQFVRTLMTSVCQSAVVFCGFYKINYRRFRSRSGVLRKYLRDRHTQLEALNALQDLMIHMEHPPNLLWMLFVSIFDEDIVKEEVFLQWKCSKTPANQTGKDAVLKSVGTFFAQLQDKKLENTGL